MAKQVNAQTFIKGYTRKGLENLVYKWSKQANRKIKEIEKSPFKSSSSAYKYLEKIQVGEQMNDIFKSHQVRFRDTRKELTKMDLGTLQKEYYKLYNFLEAKTSTVSGIKRITKKAYETYKEEYGTKYTQAQYSELFEKAKIDSFKQLYGSSELNNLTKSYNEKDAISIINSVVKEFEEVKEKDNIEIDEIFTQEYINEIKKNYEEI